MPLLFDDLGFHWVFIMCVCASFFLDRFMYLFVVCLFVCLNACLFVG